MARIVIADNAQEQQKIILDALEKLGHEIFFVEDGEAAERMYFEKKPDLMILDAAIPNRSGFQVCRSIRNDRHHGRTPVIMMSAKNRSSDRYWSLRQGADDYIGKPLDKKKLREKVQLHVQ